MQVFSRLPSNRTSLVLLLVVLVALYHLQSEYVIHSSSAAVLMQEKQTCPSPPFRFRYRNAANKIVQLASYPGSGNTWVRHLIQRGTGIYTGSVYQDTSLLTQFPGEKVRDGTVIVVKTHFPCTACWFRGKRKTVPIERSRSGAVLGSRGTIQILRNPFEALLSDFNHKQSGANHTGLASEHALHSHVFSDFALDKMTVWMDHALYHLKEKLQDGDNLWNDSNGFPVLLVYYDALQAHTERELARMFNFLNRFSAVPIDAEFAARCATNDVQGGFHRVKPSGVEDPFALRLGSSTLREKACTYFQQRDAMFWRREWCEPL